MSLCASAHTVEPPIYIAHAGGVIDGHEYTNSIEAVDRALALGYTYVELDLVLTSDSQLVALHDWELFHEITGCKGDTGAISLEEFKDRKIYGLYTPISWQDIDSLMTCHPELHLVTDKTSSPEIINRFLYPYRDRVMVECFAYDHYTTLERDGYFCLFSSVPPAKYNYRRPRFAHYVFWHREAQKRNHRGYRYRRFYGKVFAVFTLDDRYDANTLVHLDPRIRFVYIDHLR